MREGEATSRNERKDTSGGDGGKIDLAATIRDVVGALTALATLIIVPGSIALLFRLQRAQLPADLGVVSSLPSQFLVAVGLTYVAAPLLVVVGLAVAALVLPGDDDKPNPALMSIRHWKNWSGFAIGLFALVAFVGIPFAVFVEGPPWVPKNWPPWWSFLLSALAVLLWWGASYQIAKKYKTNITGRAPVTLLALVAVASFVVWAIAFAVYRADFPAATVCTADGQHFDGVLIGETDNRVYVGEPKIVSLFTPDPTKASRITFSLRRFGYEVLPVADIGDITTASTDLLIADTTPGVKGLGKVNRLDVPVLGFVPRERRKSKRAKAARAGVDKLVLQPRVETPEKLKPLVQRLIVASPRAPARRIASIATSEVTRIIIGASGVCPVPS
jgi:hypothetical protein